MGSSEPEGSSPPAMAAVIEGLKKGRQSVATLSTLRVEQLNSPTSKLLLEEITNSISKAISVLESRKTQTSMEAQLDSPSSDVTSRAPGERRSILSARRAANRKRTPYSWTRVTSATIEDGHTWRKYGQKEIFSSKHPRSYFRCTYKYDRGCKATRQVQRSDECPFLYAITYFGEHTCNAAKESNPKVHGIKEEIPLSFFSSQKQENEEEIVSNVTSIDSPSNCFGKLGMELQEASMAGLDPGWGDSFPGLNSSSASYDLEFMDLDNIFFDPTEFLAW